jgi:hypothetical protein
MKGNAQVLRVVCLLTCEGHLYSPYTSQKWNKGLKLEQPLQPILRKEEEGEGGEVEEEETPWPQSVSELYRPSDRHLPEKLVPTFFKKKEKNELATL